MEYLTVKEAADKALSCLSDIESSVGSNVGLAGDVKTQLTKAQEEVSILYDKLPSNMLATNGAGYIPKNGETK